MAHCLRALVTLTRDPGSVPSTYMLGGFQLSMTSVPGDLAPSSELCSFKVQNVPSVLNSDDGMQEASPFLCGVGKYRSL